jgi:hypothetical protein
VRGLCTKVAILSTESIASSSFSVGVAESCANCGAPLASDQRYCLECGERRTPMSSVLLGAPPVSAEEAPTDARAAGSPPGGDTAALSAGAGGTPRSNTVTVIAGVGVLLLAMGVGVLIGRSGQSKQAAAPPQVISVASTPAAASSAPASAAAFTSDWPAGTSGFAVQLETLPQAGTQVSAVEAAKTAALAKGAKGVGALKSEEFTSLTSGNYVIYAGDYRKKAEAAKALTGLKKSFPGASVIEVSNGGSSSSSSGAASSGSGAGSSQSHPAPPSVLKNLRKGGGQSYEQKSKNLPDVIETG